MRAQALGATFQIGVARDQAARFDRMRLEDRLMLEARSLIHQAEGAGSFDWKANRFLRNPEHDVWEKILSTAELRRLMSE